MSRCLEADTGGTVKLRNNHALRAIDNKSATASHHWHFAHVNTLFFGATFILKLESYIETSAESFASLEGLEGSRFRLLDIV